MVKRGGEREKERERERERGGEPLGNLFLCMF
jgi:hypothetical protein